MAQLNDLIVNGSTKFNGSVESNQSFVGNLKGNADSASVISSGVSGFLNSDCKNSYFYIGSFNVDANREVYVNSKIAFYDKVNSADKAELSVHLRHGGVENVWTSKILKVSASNVASRFHLIEVSATEIQLWVQLGSNDTYIPEAYTLYGDIPSYTINPNTVSASLPTGKDTVGIYDEVNRVAYGECTSASADAEKVVTVTDVFWDKIPGSLVTVKFTNTNTASNPTLNINGSGALPIIYNSTPIGSEDLIYAGSANRYITYVFTGAAYVFIGWSIDNNTTYADATQSTAGLMSKADKKKLDGITDSADAVAFTPTLTEGTKVGTININGTDIDLYCHTNTHYTARLTSSTNNNGNAVVMLTDGATGSKPVTKDEIVIKGSGITNVSTFLNINEDGDEETVINIDSEYADATQETAGLMSKADKKKLDGITDSADAVAFTPALTNGTKVGTININGIDIDLYCHTNTHYTSGLKVGASESATDNAAAPNGSVYINALDDDIVRDSHKIVGTGSTTVISDDEGTITVDSFDTTYTAGAGLALTDTEFTNTGVRGIETGATNGTISVNTNGSAAEVAVAGLGSAAFTNIEEYAEAGHTHNYAGSASAGGPATTALECTGNSATASKWKDARTLTLTGAMTGSVSIDGSGDVTLTTSEGDISFKRMSTVINTSTDWNAITTPGAYMVSIAAWGDASTLNSPNSNISNLYRYGLLLVFKSGLSDYPAVTQIYIPHHSGSSSNNDPITSIMVRQKYQEDKGWSLWRTIYAGITKSYIGLGNVENKSSATIRSEITKTNVTDALGYTPPVTTGLKVGASETATSDETATNGNVYINAIDDSTVRDSHKIMGTGITRVTSDTDGVITIDTSDTATRDNKGLMSADDKKKLDGIEAGSNKIIIDASMSSTSTNPVQNKVVYTALAGKSNEGHTHEVDDITDFPTELPASDVHPWAKEPTKPSYTYTEVGADESGAAAKAEEKAKAYTNEQINALVNGASGTMNTLKELEDAISGNKTIIDALNTAITDKANASDLTAHINNKNNPHSVSAAQVGLDKVDNTADADKNVLSATKLTTARSIFGKNFNGTADVVGQATVYGTRTDNLGSLYNTGAIYIREKNLIGTGSTDFSYAPSIGFHWNGVTNGSLLLHSDGRFYFRQPDGTTKATVVAHLSGNATTATTLETARNIRTNLASTSAASFDGSANITPGVTGVLGVANGGTGKTTGVDAANYFLNSLSTGSSNPSLSDYYIAQSAGGGTTTTTYHRRPLSALWNTFNAEAAKVYLPLSGGTMTGNISFKGTSGATHTMIAFKSGADVNGDVIVIGGGGLTVIGGGESAATVAEQYAAGSEHMCIAADTEINFYSNVDGGWNNRKTASFSASGIFSAPSFSGPLSGNASSATKLATARSIDGVNFDGTAAITHYGTCSTAASTAAKTVALTSFTLGTGARVAVKFTVTNTAASPTLNVNNTGAKSITYRGSAISAGYLAANRVYEFVYDGTNYELIGDLNTNTTYTASAGIKLDGTTFKHTNAITAGTASGSASSSPLKPSGTITIPSVTYDAQGHITAKGSTTATLPANATSSTDGFMSAADKSKLDAFGGIVTITKTLTITTEWQDTGISGADLESGSYIIQVSGMNSAATTLWDERFTGFMSWYSGYTDDGDNTADEIILHKAGHSSRANNIYLRTIRQDDPGDGTRRYLKLQISASSNFSSTSVTFKFRKLI